MACKQSDYLASWLADEVEAPQHGDALPPSPIATTPNRGRGTTLLGRGSALARVASGEVRQVTQLLLDPARVRIWPGNARVYAHLSEENCRELIGSIVAEGGQKVPAVVRRVEGDPAHDYEVIAGTRRHWSISWLRAHSYPDIMFVAQVAALDDEAAFRLADLENRARSDISDLERARNFAEALKTHYGSHLTRMAERLDRLVATTIKTNIRAENRRGATFSWLDGWTQLVDKKSGRSRGMTIELSNWFYEGVLMKGGVLPLDDRARHRCADDGRTDTPATEPGAARSARGEAQP